MRAWEEQTELLSPIEALRRAATLHNKYVMTQKRTNELAVMVGKVQRREKKLFVAVYIPTKADKFHRWSIFIAFYLLNIIFSVVSSPREWAKTTSDDTRDRVFLPLWDTILLLDGGMNCVGGVENWNGKFELH